jgi:hypothetical protein
VASLPPGPLSTTCRPDRRPEGLGAPRSTAQLRLRSIQEHERALRGTVV